MNRAKRGGSKDVFSNCRIKQEWSEEVEKGTGGDAQENRGNLRWHGEKVEVEVEGREAVEKWLTDKDNTDMSQTKNNRAVNDLLRCVNTLHLL